MKAIEVRQDYCDEDIRETLSTFTTDFLEAMGKKAIQENNPFVPSGDPFVKGPIRRTTAELTAVDGIGDLTIVLEEQRSTPALLVKEGEYSLNDGFWNVPSISLAEASGDEVVSMSIRDGHLDIMTFGSPLFRGDRRYIIADYGGYQTHDNTRVLAHMANIHSALRNQFGLDNKRAAVKEINK